MMRKKQRWHLLLSMWLHQLTDESEACAMASCHVMRTIEIKFSAALNSVSSERWQSQQTSMYRYVNQQISSWKNEDMLYALYHMSIESILFVWKIEQQTLCTIHWNNKCSLMSCCKLEHLYFLKQVEYMHPFLFKEVLNSHLEWIDSNESLYQKEPRNFFYQQMFLSSIVVHVEPRSWLPWCIRKPEKLKTVSFWHGHYLS